MRGGQYNGFISKNIAPKGVKQIGVYNSSGERLGGFDVGHLAMPDLGEKLYSFGALSDIHVADYYETSHEDFQNALTYFKDSTDVSFVCICGDLTRHGAPAELTVYKNIVDTYYPNGTVYAIPGNHESHKAYAESSYGANYFETYTGNEWYYSITHGNDVFIFVGCYSWGSGVFSDEEIQWLYQTLETYRDKRCFVFQHVFIKGDSGNALNLYTDVYSSGSDMMADSGDLGQAFILLMQHYKNVVFFHGHSHLRFALQELDVKANYNEDMGFRSVHIPSLAVPRDYSNGVVEYVFPESEGYVVDVYENAIVLNGIDFGRYDSSTGVRQATKQEPIATYKIDTTLQTIAANTFTDSTGTITT